MSLASTFTVLCVFFALGVMIMQRINERKPGALLKLKKLFSENIKEKVIPQRTMEYNQQTFEEKRAIM